jgi:hypothetical protein
MQHEWDEIDDEQEALDEVSTAVAEEWNATAKELENAYGELKTAKEKLDGVKKQFEAKQSEVDRLRLQAEADARTAVTERDIFKGVMNIVGGLAQSIPVGQPFLGMAGKTLSLAGDSFDWTKPDASKQIGAFFTGLSEETKSFLDDNEDLFIERSGEGIPKPPGKKEKLNLKKQLKEAKGAVESLDNKVKKGRKGVDEAIKSEWASTVETHSETLRVKERALITESEGLKDGDPNKARIQNQLKDVRTFQKELNKTAKLKFVPADSKFYDTLTRLDKAVKDRASEFVTTKEALFNKAEALEKQQAALQFSEAEYAADKQASEDKTKRLLTDLSGLSDGISKVGRGIVAITRPYNEKEVDRVTDEILKGSKYREDYEKLIAEVKTINLQKAQAAAAFGYQQQLISTYTAGIASAAAELNALSNQRQIASGLLDPGIKEYLQGMESRARENLLWSQYHFTKAWQYENLMDISDNFYNLDQWVDRFREFEREKAGLKGKKLSELTYDDQKNIANTFLKEADFIDIGNKVRQAHVSDLIRPILNERQHYPSMQKNTKKCELTPEQRNQLCVAGRVTFNLIDDFGLGSLHDVKERIADIDLEVFKIESDDANLSPSIEFRHSGVSVLLGADKDITYYKFQMGREDSPIRWGFVYNHSDYLQKKKKGDPEAAIWSIQGKGKPIRKDTLDDAAIKQIIREELGDLQYSEYRPSFFSGITLWLNRGQHHDTNKYKEFLKKIKKLEKVQFAVTYVWQDTK